MQMKYFELVKPGTNHDFVKYRRVAVTASLVVNALVLLGAIVWPKLNYGVDFAGGTELQLKFNKPVDAADVRDEVGKAGFGEPTVQVYGNPDEHQFLVRVERIALLTPERAAKVKEEVSKDLVAAEPSAFHFDPEVGDKLDFTFKKPVDPKQLQAAVEKRVGTKRFDPSPRAKGSRRSTRSSLKGPATRSAPRCASGSAGLRRRRPHRVRRSPGRKAAPQRRHPSVLYAMVMILVYVGLRFDFRFAGSHHRPHPRRHRHPRVLRRHPTRVQSHLGDGDPDGGRLFGERYHRHLRPHP
jgi:preprotein translocase subunit SecF